MSKILAVADVHIHSYPNRNPSNDFRLYQGSRTVAQNIIKVGKENGCDYIVLAGDIIEKSLLRPYVQAEVKFFLDTIMAEFKEGFIIWGNHDQDNKSSDSTITDSCLGIMLPHNLYYSHQKTVVIDGCTIGFNNWQPEFDLTWIQGKVDVLFTHARICYHPDSELFKSQVLDESKFDLAFCGDIHKADQIGKYVSIGVPQKCKMGDSDISTGIVFDCSTRGWSWVNLNPDDNLMKFQYTPNLDEEGWNDANHTWYVYKQDNTNLIGTNPNIKVDAWEEIDALVTDSISKSGLQGVHSEVLKNIRDIDSGEVDFNFTLLRFHCQNWRSIDEVELNFNDGDKILIQGGNGSGKSSLLSAIKYAFVDVSDTVGLTSLKPFIQFGTKECMTEVEFLYQGNIYIIQRGTKTYGLWINGAPQKYSEKKMFEQDIRQRFPFVKYIDAFFFDADHSQFIGGMSPERKTEIVSKFLKLDRVETYNKTAQLMSEQYRKDYTTWQGKVKETEKILDFLNNSLSSITLPSTQKEVLIRQKNEGLELQRKNQEWNRWNMTFASYTARIQEEENKVQELEIERRGFRDENTIRSEIQGYQSQIQSLQSKLLEIGNIRVNLEYKEKEYQALRNEGNNAWTEAQSIGIGKTCTHCGQIIQNTQALEQHKQELLRRVEEIRPEIGRLQEEIQSLQVLAANSQPEYNRINSEIQELNSKISSCMSEISHQKRVNDDYIKYKNMLESDQRQLQALGVVEKVELPPDFMTKMSEIENGVASWNLWNTNVQERDKKMNELGIYKQEMDKINIVLSQLDAYIKLTGLTGVIYEEIMNKLKDQFSDNMVHYVVERRGKGNREHLDLIPQFINNGNYVDYSAASSGQRSLLDIHILSKIVTRLGILILDEALKHLDMSNFDICLDMLKDMNVGCLMLSSHVESISAFNNKALKLSLNESGLSKIEFK